MAGFHTKTFQVYDDYMTPKSAWDAVKHLMPKSHVYWDSFYGNGQSGKDLRSLGFNVIHEPVDFFEDTPELRRATAISSNPPFAKLQAILPRMRALGKPFILIMPSSKINTQYFRKVFQDVQPPIQIIIPRKRIQFIKVVDGKVPDDYKSCCNFDCFYYCWKMDLPRDIIWLKDLPKKEKKKEEAEETADAIQATIVANNKEFIKKKMERKRKLEGEMSAIKIQGMYRSWKARQILHEKMKEEKAELAKLYEPTQYEKLCMGWPVW
jgi:hypothetical protein